nr:MAG TPA: hypothetical protein [Caudoviricetes sp.]
MICYREHRGRLPRPETARRPITPGFAIPGTFGAAGVPEPPCARSDAQPARC